jgi:predicted RNA-binding protein with PUA-like domain
LDVDDFLFGRQTHATFGRLAGMVLPHVHLDKDLDQGTVMAPLPRKKAAAAGRAPLQTGPARSYWLLKSEPDAFSWADQKSRGAAGEPWTGVRNYLARNTMQAMKLGDLGFFYHSNIGKEIVGIVRVIATAHPDPSDDSGTWACVDVEAVCDLPKPVSLAQVKTTLALAEMALVKSMRLSVQPVRPEEWALVCKMGGLDPKTLKPV